jgi:hypothetical protein
MVADLEHIRLERLTSGEQVVLRLTARVTSEGEARGRVLRAQHYGGLINIGIRFPLHGV